MNSLVKTNGHLVPSIPSLLNDFFTDSWLHAPLSSWRTVGATLPAANVRETNDDFRIELAAPGLKRDHFKVELDHQVLTVSYDDGQPTAQQQQPGYSHREFSYQAFERSFAMPEQKIQGDKIEARYVDGILYITVPKRDEAKVRPPRQINIS